MPLLDSSEEKPPIIGAGDLQQSRSVFGVDTLWARELQKLKEIETRERVDAEEHQKREQKDAERRRRKKKKGKSKLQETESTPQLDVQPQAVSDSLVSSELPTLPAIQKPILRRAPTANDDGIPSDSESDDDDDVPLGQSLGRITDKAADNWVVESSDEGEGPRRATGHGPRYVGSSDPLAGLLLNGGEDEDSEEDLPLTAAAERIAKRATQLPPTRLADEDEDEDKPLATMLSKSKISFSHSKLSLPNFSSDHFSGERPTTNDDDDEQPLGLRASRLPPMASHASLPNMGVDVTDEDDDQPLAFHPEQQRRTQYQMLAQLQQQQQQMMMQAQMHNSFYFGNPAMMGSGFFGQPINMGMGVPPFMGVPMPPSPPPAHDPTKYGRVDRWRHDVAVEGEQ